ncbi:MAG: flagellar regulator YcgR PilZN domain-containing protein [Burkholderiales bacterium]
MMHTRPVPLDGPDVKNAPTVFRLSLQEEIALILRQFVEGDVPMSLITAEGASYTTALWAEDRIGQLLVFSVDPTNPVVQQLLDAKEVTAVGYLDSIKVQFDLRGLVLVHGRQTTAINATYPSELFRFQRRDSYRVRPLEFSQPVVHLRHPDHAELDLSLRVLDLSHGGLALRLPDDMPAIVGASLIGGAVLELDHTTRVHLSLRVTHASSATEQGRRLGCEIVDVAPEDARALQRYIDHTQRRQRMLVL